MNVDPVPEQRKRPAKEGRKWSEEEGPTGVCRVGAVRLGEGRRARAPLAWVVLLAGTPPPVIELLAVGLLAAPEHAHRAPRLLHHVHDAVQHLEGQSARHRARE